MFYWDIGTGCAGVAQLVEYKLPKLGVASSNLVARSSVGKFFTDAIPLSLGDRGYESGLCPLFFMPVYRENVK